MVSSGSPACFKFATCVFSAPSNPSGCAKKTYTASKPASFIAREPATSVSITGIFPSAATRFTSRVLVPYACVIGGLLCVVSSHSPYPTITSVHSRNSPTFALASNVTRSMKS